MENINSGVIIIFLDTKQKRLFRTPEGFPEQPFLLLFYQPGSGVVLLIEYVKKPTPLV